MHLCVPPTAWCDGWHNCGKNDLTDEKGCASAEKVTDLLDDYSLGDDIVLRVFVPLAVFLLVVAMALCLARRYIRYKYSPVPQTPAVMYNSEKGVQIIQPESRPISPAIYDPPSYDVVVDPPPAYSSLISLAESGEIVMESGEESGDSTGRMRRKEAQRKRESYSGRAYAEAGSPKPLSQLERYRQKKYCPSDSESEDEEARQRRRKKGGKSKSRVTKQGSSSQSSEQTSPSIELQPLSRDRHTPCSSSSIHGMSPLAAPSHHRVHNGEGGCSDAGRTAVVDKDSSLTDRTRNNAAVLSTTASSTSRGANSDDKHSPEHTQEFIPIHKEASNQHRQHAHVPNSYRSCGDRHVDVNATTSTDNSTNFMNDSEESKKEPKGRAVKNGHVNRGGAVQCHTAEINISNPTAHLPVEHTVNGDSNSLKEKEDKETCRLGGSSSGDHLVEAKIKEESRVTGNGVSHTSVEAV
ncbi:uncharacterized protein LOC101852841 [Aplysia californica]|uniref:Uncharacterized protein LOC101852841 n=1 Tax=Aplysia californica TaxID=6500 RepID=A0ABM0JJC7_APLCA|nr:uncharacterized protein LOC101852841 [Aplysia californica]